MYRDARCWPRPVLPLSVSAVLDCLSPHSWPSATRDATCGNLLQAAKSIVAETKLDFDGALGPSPSSPSGPSVGLSALRANGDL